MTLGVASRRRASLTAVLCLVVGACSGPNIGPNVRSGSAAYEVIPAPVGELTAQDYRIGPLDSVDITVFQEGDISSKGVVVDASGDLSMPLIGRIHAGGLTTTQLAEVIRQRLGARFYVNPQVSVVVSSSVSQRITVQGQVTEPGIYPIQGATTLLDAMALAKGETENAALNEVLVIRYVEGKRMAAVFNVARVRRGDDPDPAILARDVVIVGNSNLKKIWHDTLRAAPLFGVFTQF
ncbi:MULTISPECIES: polysaccharide biosynthesis/export family protein [unclassified Sphingomonas]|uniref:polysaccharide biosynthesis/export family protein n=1 Tax=unclassified Sphingomonas TaxID=196159 RepID=UPI000ABABEF4|nr:MULTISPECIES: polysaccharide biosynthesis/export family protein [unclassified Sphingomonas]